MTSGAQALTIDTPSSSRGEQDEREARSLLSRLTLSYQRQELLLAGLALQAAAGVS